MMTLHKSRGPAGSSASHSPVSSKGKVKGYRQHKGATHFEPVLEEGTERILQVVEDDAGDGSMPLEDAFMVPINWLRSNPEQPRQFFDEKKIERYADSMQMLSAKGQGIHGSGIIQALLARRAPGSIDRNGQWIKGPGCLVIVAGESRWHAAKRAGLATVPVVVRDASEDDAYEMALIENIQRADLTPMEEAISYRALMNQKKMGIRKFADYIGKDRGEIWNRLSLLNLTDEEQAVLNRRPDTQLSLQAIKKTRKDVAFHRSLLDLIASGATYPDIVREVKHWEARARAEVGRAEVQGAVQGTVNASEDVEMVSTPSEFDDSTLSHNGSEHGNSPGLQPEDSTPSYYGHGPGPNTLPRIAYHEHLQSVVNQLANIHDAIKGVPPTPTLRNTKTLPLVIEARRWLDLIEQDSAKVIERRAQGK